MTTNKKTFSATVEKDGGGLGPRQIDVLASNARKDRVNDVLVPTGCKTSGKVVILADHDTSLASVIGLGEVSVKSSGVRVRITFLDEGMSDLADLACKLYKAGIMTDVSVGFDPIDFDYDKSTGGYLFKTWELLELSCVTIGCNPDAKVTGKARGSTALSSAQLKEAREMDRRLAAQGILPIRPYDDPLTTGMKMRARIAALDVDFPLTVSSPSPAPRKRTMAERAKDVDMQHRADMATLSLAEQQAINKGAEQNSRISRLKAAEVAARGTPRWPLAVRALDDEYARQRVAAVLYK